MEADDDMDNRIIKEVTNFASEGNQNKQWVNKIWSNMEAAGDLGNKIADVGYERHDLLEKDRFELIKQDLILQRDRLLDERDSRLREEIDKADSESETTEANDSSEDRKTEKSSESESSSVKILKQTPIEVEFNERLDLLEDQITYYTSLDHTSTKEPNDFFPARMMTEDNLPDPLLFDDSQSVTRQVTLRTGNILTEPNVASSLNEYYFFKKRGIVSGAKFNWIHAEDYCRLVDFCIRKNDVEGVLNAVSPADISRRHGVENTFDVV